MTFFLTLLFYIGLLLLLLLPVFLSIILWKKNRVYALLVLSLLPCFCGSICVFFDGYYLPFKPCRPFTYPDKNIKALEGENYSQITADPLTTVLSFYDEQLTPQTSASNGVWVKEKQGLEYLYQCSSIDINFSTTETGCIYVNENQQGTHIRTKFLRSEGGSWVCPRP